MKQGKWKRFLAKLNNPPNWIELLTYGSAVIVCPLAVIAAIFGYGHNVYAYMAYTVCGLLFIYAVYIGIKSWKRAKKKFLVAADKYKFTRNFFKNYEFRTLFLSAFSLLGNIGYTVFLCVIAVMSDSMWYGALAVYYILLTVARGGILFENNRNERKYKHDPVKLRASRVGLYKYCGIMLLVLTLAFAISVVEMVLHGGGFYVPVGTIYAFAAFTAYRVALAVYNFIKSKRYDNRVVRAVRYINFSTALVSILSLQTALFDAFPPDVDPTKFNAITGGLVCLVIVIFGVRMLVYSYLAKKRMISEEADFAEESQRIAGYNREDYGNEYGRTMSAFTGEFLTEEPIDDDGYVGEILDDSETTDEDYDD